VPCDIDYQLCRPVPEDLLGVEYVNEYLRRVVLENDFLRRFPKEPVIKLLENYCPDYRGLLINLYEPVATNALGSRSSGGTRVRSIYRAKLSQKSPRPLRLFPKSPFGKRSDPPRSSFAAASASGMMRHGNISRGRRKPSARVSPPRSPTAAFR
jgi:hypothetical protein